MVWKYEKFIGDMAIYAIYPKCDHMLCVGGAPLYTYEEPEITNLYKYCPFCGEYLYDDSEEVDVAWNERNMLEVFGVTEEGEET